MLYCGFSTGFSSPPSQSITLSVSSAIDGSMCFGFGHPKIQSLKAKNKEKIISVNGIFFSSVSVVVATDALIVLAACIYNYITKLIDEIIAAQNACKCMCD